MPSHRERGAVTVEFAVALPAVALVLTALVAAVLVVDGRGRLELAAATAVRALGRGDETAARAAFDRIAPGASIRVSRPDGLVCVDTERTGTGPFAAVAVHAATCTVDGGR
ncbi:TadE/TadG family type IV pilus assembly protein [Curtobacterium sp. MCLR17_036]|uniref:TadE/TadG family type IV pilus assembly protein n=1 Tax=Curtobacterium sp. MCLR17_036 TaxID=2175620 RepID=UPI000DAA9D37|nr:TadE/TadG family type IV pilus assembly protein [Curtobacterium sp. MCLR17_036]WIE63890.1 TadE/TadG family type IV pilus assembly protein [Curtobacterium sp. MCLR17_036]